MSELQGIARFKIHEGKLDEFKRLSAQAMEIVQTKDPGTLQYDTYFNDDESECIVLERFRDSEALIAHSANLSDLSEGILSIVSVVHGELLGEPNAEIGANLAGMEVPQLFRPYSTMQLDEQHRLAVSTSGALRRVLTRAGLGLERDAAVGTALADRRGASRVAASTALDEPPQRHDAPPTSMVGRSWWPQETAKGPDGSSLGPTGDRVVVVTGVSAT